MKSNRSRSWLSTPAGLRSALVVLALTAMTGPPAGAGVPDPTNSDCDQCLLLSPDGTFRYRLTLRDDASAPVADAAVFLDFTASPGITLCPESDPDADGIVEGTTDALGVVDFYIRGGGQDVNPVSATSQLITFCLARARTPDLSSNLIIDAADVDAHQALPIGSLAGDYDCDGDSDAADLAEIQSRIGRNCSSVQISSETWGKIKSFYR